MNKMNVAVYICFCVFLVQNRCDGQGIDTLTKEQKRNLEENEIYLYNLADISIPLIIKDTLGADSIKQKYYPNGQVYSITPYKEGQVHGTCYKFNSNGSLKSRIVYGNGQPIDNLQIEYDIFGYVRIVNFNMKLSGKCYLCQTICYYGEPCRVYVFLDNGLASFSMVSEYTYVNETDEWRVDNYHTNPSVGFAKKILKAYMRVYEEQNLLYLIRKKI